MAVILEHPGIRIELRDFGIFLAKVSVSTYLDQAPSRAPHHSLVLNVEFPLPSVPTGVDPEHYQVLFTLGQPFNNPYQNDVSPIGDSLLEIGLAPIRFLMERGGEESTIVLIPNERGRLSQVAALIPAVHSDTNAEANAYAAVRPLLSQFSVLYQIPLEAVRVERFLFIRPNVIKYGCTVLLPYPSRRLTMNHLSVFHDFGGLYALEQAINHYREGLNCWSPLQRFLSWFKAIEAVGALRQDLLKRNPKLRFRRTVVSDTPEIRFKHSSLIGEPHTKVVDAFLRNPYRNATAHWKPDDKSRTDMTYDHRYGLLSFYLLCHVAEDVFMGMFKATVEAVSGSFPDPQ